MSSYVSLCCDETMFLHIATESNNYDLLSLFSHVKSNDKFDDKSDDKAQEEKEESKKQEEKRKMNQKSLETSYDEIMSQLMAAKYFLIRLGCELRNKTNIKGVLHKSLEYKSGDHIDFKGNYSDDFYYSLKDLIGNQITIVIYQ